MPGPTLVIYTAVRMEHRAIARRLRARHVSADVAAAEVAGVAVELRTVGIGAVRLPATIPPGVRCVVLAGLGGGLDPALRVGDVVVDLEAFGDAAVPVGTAKAGQILTASRPLTTPAAKAIMFRKTGAAVVEMEGFAVRRVAAAAGVRFAHVRAVSDAAGDAVDPAVLGLVDPVGRARPLAVATYVARHPGRILALVRLGAAAGRAADRLADAVAELVPALLAGEPPNPPPAAA